MEKDQLTDLLVKMLVESNPITEANLRLRCWEMLQKIGQKERLVKLLADASVKPDDRLLSNLRSCAGELGIVPTTKEEILWLQALLETKTLHLGASQGRNHATSARCARQIGNS